MMLIFVCLWFADDIICSGPILFDCFFVTPVIANSGLSVYASTVQRPDGNIPHSARR